MKVGETMKGNSFLFETNCNIIEKNVMYLWQKNHQPSKEGLATHWASIIQVENMPLIG
jgi:hypothetical protein